MVCLLTDMFYYLGIRVSSPPSSFFQLLQRQRKDCKRRGTALFPRSLKEEEYPSPSTASCISLTVHQLVESSVPQRVNCFLYRTELSHMLL